jgi:hypothetical protein
MWTQDETQFLLENYSDLGATECSTILNKSFNSVTSKAFRLNIKSKPALLTHKQYRLRLASTEYEVIGIYSGYSTKILHRHIKCGYEWEISPILIPNLVSCPKCSKKNYSQIALDWIRSFHNPNIMHAENGGERKISGYKVDGYDPVTNTVYEFHGDVFHGNLDIFEETDYCHPFNKTITAMELFHETAVKMDKLSEFADVIYIWEKDYKSGGQYVKIIKQGSHKVDQRCSKISV